MTLVLHTNAGNKNAFKALIAAEYANVKIEVPEFTWGVTNKSEEFLKLTPIGKVPVLETPSGPIFESNAIAKYIARLSENGLYGSSLYEVALIDQWVDFAVNELDIPLGKWGLPLHGFGERIPLVEEAAIVASKRALAALNSHLANNTYLVGHSVTIADIVTIANLYNPIKGLLSAKFLQDYPHVQRYFFTLVNQPNFKKVIGEVVQVAETPTDILPKDKSIFAQYFKNTATSKPKEVKKEKPKKAEKPKETPAEEEEEAPKPKPAKSPLDLLPPSPMVMDAWKRLYSNTKAKDFREVAIKGFWDMYDAEGYSLWFCDYKYNDENQVKFVTLNKVSGFLQRMDIVRKHGFAKICILGDNPPFVIKGVWLFRGPEVPKIVLEECYDAELYEWTKVDISDETQKNLVSDYFEEPDVIGGLTLVEAKCFK